MNQPHRQRIIITLFVFSVLYVRECGGSKPKLKLLTSMYLNLLIQNGQDGHDSVTDAKCAMKLVLYNLLPASEFDDLFGCFGRESTEFLHSYEKFLELSIVPHGTGVAWIHKVSTFLNDLTRELEKTSGDAVDLNLCPYFFFQPPKKYSRIRHQTNQRRYRRDMMRNRNHEYSLSFYIGINSDGIKIPVEQELQKFQSRCRMLGLSCREKFVRKSELSRWTLGPDFVQHPKNRKYYQTIASNTRFNPYSRNSRNETWLTSVALTHNKNALGASYSNDQNEWNNYSTRSNNRARETSRNDFSERSRQSTFPPVQNPKLVWFQTPTTLTAELVLPSTSTPEFSLPMISTAKFGFPLTPTASCCDSDASASSEQSSLSCSSSSISSSSSEHESSSVKCTKRLNPNASEFILSQASNKSKSKLNPLAGEFVLSDISNSIKKPTDAKISNVERPSRADLCKENRPKNECIRKNRRKGLQKHAKSTNGEEKLQRYNRQKNTKRRRNRYRNVKRQEKENK